MDFELDEIDPQHDDKMAMDILETVRQLGGDLTPADLDVLQQDEAYITWALRLSPYVQKDDTLKRAQSFLNHANSQVRFWASEVLKSIQS